MKASIKGNTLILELPMVKNPPLSKSGKTHLVVSTGGFADAGATVNGKPLRIAVNAIIPA